MPPQGPRMQGVRRGLATKSAKIALAVYEEGTVHELAKALKEVLGDMETATEDQPQAVASAPVQLVMCKLMEITGSGSRVEKGRVNELVRLCREAAQ
jgi:hypothetical protein